MADVLRNEYEMVLVARPTLGEEGITALNEKLAQVIAGQSGEVQETEMWGKRTLAYPIKKFFEGVYVLHRIALPPQNTAEVERYMRFNEDILRYLILRTDEE